MKTISREEFEKRNVFGTGAENTGFAQYFIGNSFLNPLTTPGKAGEGWYQEDGKEACEK